MAAFRKMADCHENIEPANPRYSVSEKINLSIDAAALNGFSPGSGKSP